jgi:hypothetical protein
MSNTDKQLEALLDAVEEKKKSIQAAALIAKTEFLDALDAVEDKIDDIDTDSLKMRLVLAKLKVQEEWDEIEEKLEGLGGKAKEIAESSEDEIKDGWESTKKIAGDIEQRITKFFT